MAELEPYKILIADDSSIIRRAIALMVRDVPDIEICAEAHDGVEALEKLKTCSPDIIILDIEMPRKTGLDVLRELGPGYPVPILVFSGKTHEGATTTIEALKLGAADYLFKGNGDMTLILEMRHPILEKIRAIAGDYRARKSNAPEPSLPVDIPATDSSAESRKKEVSPPVKLPVRSSSSAFMSLNNKVLHSTDIVVIGASTGGPSVLLDILNTDVKSRHFAYLVIQHMPKMFTPFLAERLGDSTGMPFMEATDGDKIKPGCGYVAPGEMDLIVKPGRKFKIVEKSKDRYHHPDIDLAMESVSIVFGKRALGVLLSGMGRDGAAGLKKLREAGSVTWAQDGKSCVVDGMPKAARELGAVMESLSPKNLAAYLRLLAQKRDAD